MNGVLRKGGILLCLQRCFFSMMFDVGFCFAYSGGFFTKTLVGVSFRTGLRGQGRGEIDFRCQSSPLPCPPRPPTPPLLTGLVWVRTNILTRVEGGRKVLYS